MKVWRYLLVMALVSGLMWSCKAKPVCDLDLSPRVRLATTTSTDNSGLLSYLLPHFEQRFSIRVEVIAVGTGRALRLAQNGDVDVVMVHAPQAELEFVETGYGINRRSVMYNEFVIVGPSTDPAGIRGESEVAEAFRRIERSGSKFASRGDDSGTHMKERAIWEAADLTPVSGETYIETGQGMAATLRIADEMAAYCLTDIATYLTHRQTSRLDIMVEGDPVLRNPYHVIAVNSHRHPDVDYLEAMLLIAWLTSPEACRLIEDFSRDGRVLFTPDP